MAKNYDPYSPGKERLVPTAGGPTGYEPPVTFPAFDVEGETGVQEGEKSDWGEAEGSRDPNRPGRAPAKESGES